MNNRVKSIIIWSVVVIVVVLSTKRHLKLYMNSKMIDLNGSVVIGYITDYYEVGIANYYMEYEYSIDNLIHKNKVSVNKMFKNCEHDRSCIGKSIYIKYCLDDTTISKPIYDSIPKNR